MKNTNTIAAIVLAVGMVASSWILYLGLCRVGQGAALSRTKAVQVPGMVRLQLSTKSGAPIVVGLEDDGASSSREDELSGKSK